MDRALVSNHVYHVVLLLLCATMNLSCNSRKVVKRNWTKVLNPSCCLLPLSFPRPCLHDDNVQRRKQKNEQNNNSVCESHFFVHCLSLHDYDYVSSNFPFFNENAIPNSFKKLLLYLLANLLC